MSLNDDLKAKNKFLRDVRYFSEDYIIVKSQVFKFLVENAEPHVIIAVQQMQQELIPNPKELDPASSSVHTDIKLIRKTNDITQAKLAEKADIDQPDICDFEKNGVAAGFGIDRVERIINAIKELVA